MRSNLLSLQNIARQQDIVQNRLATGLKVSSAIDNPSAYYTAASLSNRAADLTALLDAMSQGVQTIKTASEAIDSGIKFLEQAKAVANQALETAEPVVARVSDEEELLAAIDSGQKGLIVIDSDITLSENQTLTLNDGQSLVGAHYLDKNAETTGLSFNFSGTIDNAVEAGNNSIISDLKINLTTDTRGIKSGSINEKAVIFAENKTSVKIRNLNINIDTTAANEVIGFFAVKLNETSAVLSGNIDISTDGDYTRGIYAAHDSRIEINNAYINGRSSGMHSSMLQSYFNSVVNINESQINLRTQGYGAAVYLYNTGTINVYGKSKLNIQTNGASSQGICGDIGNNSISFNDGSRCNLNITKTSYTYPLQNCNFILNDQSQAHISGGSGIYQSKIFLNSSASLLVIDNDPAFFPSNSAYSSITAVVGASIALENGLYTAFENVRELEVNERNLTILEQYFLLDSTRPAKTDQEIADMFADFETYMKNGRGTDDNKNRNYVDSGQYNRLLGQYDSLLKDASYKGINLLDGQKLKINFNEDRSSQIDVMGVKADSESLGLVTKEWTNAGDIEKSISELESAICSLRSFASAFGNYYSIVTTRQDFTENLINVLEEGADKLTLADMNEESANMLALQTSQQLAINSLSLASQAAQSVLKLF